MRGTPDLSGENHVPASHYTEHNQVRIIQYQPQGEHLAL